MKNAGKFPEITQIAEFFAAALCLLVLSGCAGTVQTLPEYERRSPDSGDRADGLRRISADRPLLVGKVSLVNTEDGFVLIEMETARQPRPGMNLITMSGQMKTADLKVSRERRPPFLIADITRGLPNQEDGVFVPPSKPASTSGGSVDPAAYDGEADLPVPELELLPAEEAVGDPDAASGLEPLAIDPDHPAPLFETGDGQ